MTTPLSPELVAFGATYTPAQVARGQAYWRLMAAVGPYEWGGRHHIFVDVLGEAGQRLTGIPVRFFWADRDDTKRTEAKPGEPAAVDFPMYAGGNSYGVQVAGGMPSDSIFGMGLVPFKPHVCFRLVFKRTLADAPSPVPEPEPPPVEDATLREALDQIQHWLNVAKARLP